MNASSFAALREAAFAANMQLPELGLVQFTFGNASTADHSLGVFAIKPSGVPYNQLSPDKMVVVDFEGQTVWGSMRPSSDTLTHAVLYRHWPGVGGIAHTHSVYASAWAQAGRSIPVYGTTHADHCCVDVPCIPPLSEQQIAKGYEIETGVQIVQYFREHNLDPKNLSMVLLSGHAPFTWGASAEKAVYHSAVVETLARLALLTEQLNPQVGRLHESLIQKHQERKHGPMAYYGQPAHSTGAKDPV